VVVGVAVKGSYSELTYTPWRFSPAESSRLSE
jgi:hypothetical protein